MKYNVTGAVPLVINDKYILPGEALDSSDIPDGINVDALIAGGHLEKAPTRRTKHKVEDK